MRIHNVFHVSLLEPYREDTIPGRKQEPPPPIVIPEGDVEWEIHKILDSRISGRGRKLQYLISWKGYGPKQNSWEPAVNLKNAPNEIK